MDEQAAARAERDERILDVIRSLREGEVVTYGGIAADAGYPKLSRLVGRLLALGGGSEDDLEEAEEELPWWRVVNSAGRLVPGNEREQAAQLRAEGVEVRDGRVRNAPVGRFSRPR
ncbi:MAG: MGMT family protein [Actinobacteria bacterium]|nr:MGMT family protein [Actinomycetota bacterium]